MRMLAGPPHLISPPSSSSSSSTCPLLLFPTTTSLLTRPQTSSVDHDTWKKTRIPPSPSSSSRSLFSSSHRFRSVLLRSQKRPGNDVSEDTDEMFDELFDKYGKVVYTRNDQKPPAAELDDDAESLSFAIELAKVANEVDAIGFKIRDLAEKQYKRVATGDYKPNSWTLLDFGDVVVHIFLPPQRAHYNLEEFYANATPIELPFENQNQFRR